MEYFNIFKTSCNPAVTIQLLKCKTDVLLLVDLLCSIAIKFVPSFAGLSMGQWTSISIGQFKSTSNFVQRMLFNTKYYNYF